MKKDSFFRLNKILVLAVVFFATAFCVYADISFEDPDLNPENKIVFTVSHEIPGSKSYSTAFMADAATLSGIKILTCYPEKMELLSKGAVLQIRNRYGTARFATGDSTLSWVTRTDSVPWSASHQTPQSVSPDGKWICYVKKTGGARGELILKNASTLQETILNKVADFSYDKVPVLWNPDSSSLLYEKEGTVYFCDPKAAFQKVQMTEEFRKIGAGSIRSVFWANSKTLIYIDRDLIYRVGSNELYTRGLYSQMVGSGTVIGRLPVKFDSRYDKFSVNSRVNALSLVQANKIVSLFRLKNEGFEYLETIYSKPFTDVSGTVIDCNTFWSYDSKCLVWVNTLGFEDGAKKSAVYSLASDLKLLAIISDAGEPVVSEDCKKICYSQGKSLFVYDISLWKLIDRLDGEKFSSYLWNGNSMIYAGGQSTVREWVISNAERSGSSRILFLSSAKKVFWKSPSSICALDSIKKDTFYDYDMVSGTWTSTESSETVNVGEPTLQNGRYRVFTGATPNKKFANTLYVRTLAGKSVTNPLFPETAVKADGLKKVSIVVDALDDSTGLSRILYTLKEYGISSTFFVNGEFIRRYPKETKQIIKSGFDCGSMFFTNADLTIKGFVVDEDFIRRGLARNEDEFFEATGKELIPVWHAPFYKSKESIKKYGNSCGYRYIEAGRFSLDTITLEDAANGKPGYLSASQIIEFYAENSTDGSVIPLSAGIACGTRSDYLYEKLDLLIGTLLDEGFVIVDVNGL